MELHTCTLTTDDKTRVEVPRYEEARTSCGQESAPMDVDGHDALTGKYTSGVKGAREQTRTQQVAESSECHRRRFAGCGNHTVGSCQAQADTKFI